MFQLADAAAVLAAAEVVGHADNEHHAADQREEVGKRKGDVEILEEIGWHEVRRKMHHRGEAADDGADHHLQSAIGVLPCQIHDLDGNLRVFALDRILLAAGTPHAGDERHLFVFLHQIVVLVPGCRIEQRLTDEVEPAHLLVSPALFFRGILIGMIDLGYFLEGVFYNRRVRVTRNTKLVVKGLYTRHAILL